MFEMLLFYFTDVSRGLDLLVMFTIFSLQVGRRGNLIHDAAVIQEVRKRVGNRIDLRADANRNWTFEEAVQFGSLVKDCDLQYIEV